MRKDLKPELGVFVEQLESLRRVLSAVLLDEALVGEQPLESLANLFAPAWPAIARENGPAILHKVLKSIGHGTPPYFLFVPTYGNTAVASISRRASRWTSRLTS